MSNEDPLPAEPGPVAPSDPVLQWLMEIEPQLSDPRIDLGDTIRWFLAPPRKASDAPISDDEVLRILGEDPFKP